MGKYGDLPYRFSKHIVCFLADLELIRTHAIPNVEKKLKYFVETISFPGPVFFRKLEVIAKPE